jgi:hypothetical protein
MLTRNTIAQAAGSRLARLKNGMLLEMKGAWELIEEEFV